MCDPFWSWHKLRRAAPRDLTSTVQRETVVSPLTVGGTTTVLQATQVDPDPAHHDRVDHR
jgi:hypothetical protein